MNTDKLITDEEVEQVKNSGINLVPGAIFGENFSLEDLKKKPDSFKKFLEKLKPFVPKPVHLKSGYNVTYSMDEMPDGTYEHIAVSGKSKSDDRKNLIAKRILGNNYEKMGIYFNNNVNHYRKKIK